MEKKPGKVHMCFNGIKGFQGEGSVTKKINLLGAQGEKRSELGSDGGFLHQDNVSAPMALSVKQFLTSKNATVMGHPAYSPNWVP
ncbi:hypothetical protein TNCV_1798541 [Trichonephila clavipes]|uniref:Uncharacterized protein n=1 Tax=Trichonephila clavipes TaxID=2585209 RepID=A0A8X6SNT2_TRICX|nr:hypothetical protein TNCV_1798541 [Trichonephila clavipes]